MTQTQRLTETAAPPAWALELRENQRHLTDGLLAFRKDAAARFDALEHRQRDDHETILERLGRFSDRAKAPSQHDLETQARLATEITTREERDRATAERIERIEGQTAFLVTTAKKLLGNPTVRVLFTAAASAAAAWLAAHR